MKRLMSALALAMITSTVSAEPPKEKPDWNGIWTDVSGPSIRNAYLILAQDGDDVHMTHYLEFNGTPMVEYGTGAIKNGKAVLRVKVSKPIPGWATSGTHALELSEDGDRLKGEFEDARGYKGPLEFMRLQPGTAGK